VPAIPATWEAEIRRIVVQSQPGQIVHKTLSQKYLTEREREKERGREKEGREEGEREKDKRKEKNSQ
jgi:hypothetical protein